MTQEDMQKLIDARINVALDSRLGSLEDAFLKHEATMKVNIENLVQQISGVGSDVKALQKDFVKYTGKVNTLETDKETRDDWVTWFIRTVFGILILAIAFLLGIKIK